ncbi:MAG: NAD(P)-dependent oxidoreductase [Armatimonadetes bacterium]|nr:NAD(P)-dependent oxidoreductase [Armatimonadota bacterium]
MRALITGGAGFLGLHAANGFHQRGAEVELLDIAEIDPSEYPEGIVLHKVDVRDSEAMGKVVAHGRYDAIVHGAAALPLWKKEDIFTTNVDGTRRVLEAAVKHAVPRVVFIGSTAVYGVPEKHPIYEDDPLQGVGPYGESKILAERVCLEFREQGRCVPIIRPKTFIGPARLGIFQVLYDWANDGKRIPMIGKGDNRYQLLDVADLVEAIWLATTAELEAANDTFNVGAERFGTVREDLQALCDFAQSGARPAGFPAGPVKAILRMAEILKLSPLYKWIYATADRDSFVSVEKIKERLGWSARYSNAEALIRSYQWFLEHKSELQGASGITHRTAWNQGILKLFKRFM